MDSSPSFDSSTATYMHPFIGDPNAAYVWLWEDDVPLTGLLCVSYIAYGLFTTWVGSWIVKLSKFDDPRLNVRLAFELGACLQFVSWLPFVAGLIPLPTWSIYAILWGREFFDMIFFQLAAGQFSEHYMSFLHRHHLFSTIGRVVMQATIGSYLQTNALVNWGARTVLCYYCCSICPVLTEPVDRMWLVKYSDDIRGAVRALWFIGSRVSHLATSYWLTILGAPYIAPESIYYWYGILGSVVVLNEANSIIFGIRSCCTGQARRRAASIAASKNASTNGSFSPSVSPAASPSDPIPSPGGTVTTPNGTLVLRERRSAKWGAGLIPANGTPIPPGRADSPAGGIVKKMKRRMAPPPISPLMRSEPVSLFAHHNAANKKKAAGAGQPQSKKAISIRPSLQPAAGSPVVRPFTPRADMVIPEGKE